MSKNNDKKVKKEKIKKFLLKFIHVICYICTFLFLLVCVLSGLKSCTDKKNNVQPYNSTIQDLNRNSQTQLVYHARLPWANSYEITPSNSHDIYDSLQGLIDVDTYVLNANFQITLDDDVDSQALINCVSYTIKFNQYYQSGWLVLEAYFTRDTGAKYYVVQKVDDEGPEAYLNFWYSTGDVRYVYLNDSVALNGYYFTYFFTPLETQNFTFNQQINFNAPMGLTISSKFGPLSLTGLEKEIYNGLFVSNGIIFNKITAMFVPANSVWFYDGSDYFKGPSTEWAFVQLCYYPADDGPKINVNLRDMTPYTQDNGGISQLYSDSSHWVNDGFRFIKFLEALNDSDYVYLNSFNNNYSSNLSWSNGSTNVFVLLGNAFNELLPFLNIMILPNISIGVLMFLPLVVGIIVILFKILKK